MSRANTSNAHVRAEASKKDDLPTQAAEAERLLKDPAFVRGYDNLREGLVKVLEDHQSDGTEESDRLELEITRSLRTLKSLRRQIGLSIQGHKLQLAEFQARNPSQRKA